MRGVSESLAGRVAILNLLGLSHWEMEQQAILDTPFLPTDNVLKTRHEKAMPSSLSSIYGSIWRGSFPALSANKNADKDLFYSSYLQTYLQRDIRDLAQVLN